MLGAALGHAGVASAALGAVASASQGRSAGHLHAAAVRGRIVVVQPGAISSRARRPRVRQRLPGRQQRLRRPHRGVDARRPAGCGGAAAHEGPARAACARSELGERCEAGRLALPAAARGGQRARQPAHLRRRAVLGAEVARPAVRREAPAGPGQHRRGRPGEGARATDGAVQAQRARAAVVPRPLRARLHGDLRLGRAVEARHAGRPVRADVHACRHRGLRAIRAEVGEPVRRPGAARRQRLLLPWRAADQELDPAGRRRRPAPPAAALEERRLHRPAHRDPVRPGRTEQELEGCHVHEHARPVPGDG